MTREELFEALGDLDDDLVGDVRAPVTGSNHSNYNTGTSTAAPASARKRHRIWWLAAAAAVLVCLIVVGASSRGTPDMTRTMAETEARYMTLDEIVRGSNVAIIGEYEETVRSDLSTEQKFRVKECLYGDVSEEEIWLFSYNCVVTVGAIDYNYVSGQDIYQTGKDYLLVLEKLSSVMQEHDCYLQSGDQYFCVTDNQYRLYSQDVKIPEGMSMKEYICSLPNSAADASAAPPAASYSSELEEMVQKSVYVGQIRIEELAVDVPSLKSNVYACSVEKLYKGENPAAMADGMVWISLLKDSVEVGGTYLVGFSPVDENSLIYSQASAAGVFPAGDPAVLSELLRLLEGT